MKILIINLARLGDLIQSIGLIKGLLGKHPDAQIDFLALSSFAPIIEHFEHINQAITLNDKIILENLQNNLWAAYSEVKDKIYYLNGKNYDLIVNPIASIHSALIGYLMRGKEKLGMFYTGDRETRITSNSTAFHLSFGHGGGDHTFNLVDIFSGVGKVSTDCEQFSISPSEYARQKAEVFWEDNHLTQYKTIGFHIGASNANRAWSPENFRSIIDRLIARRQFKVVLFGGYKEQGLPTYFSDIESDYFLNLIGKTNLDELIAFIGKLDIFVSNDTGPMHIAAATGRRMITIFLGPASVWATAPYSDKAIVLEPDIDCHPCSYDNTCSHLNCHDFINPEAVEQAIIAHLNGKENLISDDRIRYWQSTRDIFALQHFVPVQKREIEKGELFFELKRCVWAISLLGGLDGDRNLADSYMDYLSDYYDLPQYSFSEILSKIVALMDLNKELTDNLRLLSSMQATNYEGINEIQSNWAAVKKQKENLFSEAENVPECSDFLSYARIRESSLSGDNFGELAMETTNIYSTLGVQLTLLRDFLKKSHSGF